MRSAIHGLPSPHPLSTGSRRSTRSRTSCTASSAALDEVVAPDLLVLDNLAAHLSSGTAPADFLRWLGQWAAVQQDQGRPEALRREVVAAAVGQHRIRGTRHGLVQAVRRATGTEPEIRENGGTAWSPRPGTALPGTPGARVTVRLRSPTPRRSTGRRWTPSSRRRCPRTSRTGSRSSPSTPPGGRRDLPHLPPRQPAGHPLLRRLPGLPGLGPAPDPAPTPDSPGQPPPPQAPAPQPGPAPQPPARHRSHRVSRRRGTARRPRNHPVPHGGSGRRRGRTNPCRHRCRPRRHRHRRPPPRRP